MSKKNLIALAIAAVLVSPAAYAVNVTPMTPDVFPTNAFVNNTVTVSNGAAIKIAAAADDNYLGRTTGYNIRVTLGGGATFASVVNPALITGLNGETVTIAGGGQVGDTSVTFTVTPAAAVVQGDGIAIGVGAFNVKNVAFMANDGAKLTIDVRVGDPVGGQELASRNGTAIAEAVQGWKIDFAAPANTAIRIDVGSNSGKKKFSSTGAVNLADTLLFNAGKVSVALDNSLTHPLGLNEATATAPLKVSGADFSAFAKIFMSANADCSTEDKVFTIASNSQSASLASTVTVDDLQAAPHICFKAGGATVIQAQDLAASLSVSQTGTISSPAVGDNGDVLDMAYNGAVVRVYHFNPSTNADQVSYLRVTNTSATTGLFTIDSVCDDGTAGSPVKFNLAAGRSILLTSGDIENGNATKGLTGAAGACTANNAAGVTAKRRLTITGEVGSMEVQNFLRNVTSAGMINTNVNNED